jgi:predicted dehydrogenase
MLNTSHGADYFRRWHSRKECSGGLLVHKSTHHFDLINWWLDGIPALVFGLGGLVFYGKKNAMSRGNDAWTRYERYTGVPASKGDPFRLDVDSDPAMRGLYYNAEAETGYIRDQNVFREDIDIEDSMSLLIKYRRGEMVTYSLNAYCPAEGFRASISGDAGRIEYVENHSSHIITGDPEIKEGKEKPRVHPVEHCHFNR